MKISVIVPVFGIEKYIARCAETLFLQTFKDDVEYIFINDCSKDNSVNILIDVIAKFPERACQTKIIHHEKNLGLPSARNTGLVNATGEYVIHIDGDDFVEPTMLEDMYLEAVKKNADIVWSDIYLTYEDSERYLAQPNYSTPEEALHGILKGKMKYNVWNKLVRRELYIAYNIKFPDGLGMGEDMTMIKLFCNAKSSAYIPKAYYHYIKINTQAFSQTYSNKHLKELRQNVDDLSAYLERRLANNYTELISNFKLEVKFPFLISDKKEKYKLWQDWFSDANAYVWKNPSISFRRKLLQGMASLNQWWYVRLYYKILYKSPLMRILNR